MKRWTVKKEIKRLRAIEISRLTRAESPASAVVKRNACAAKLVVGTALESFSGILQDRTIENEAGEDVERRTSVRYCLQLGSAPSLPRVCCRSSRCRFAPNPESPSACLFISSLPSRQSKQLTPPRRPRSTPRSG